MLVLTAMLLSSYIFSQNTAFGLKAGVNFSNIWVEKNDFDLKSSDYKTGFYAGGLAHIHVSEKFAIQPELFYSTQGGKSKGNGYTYTTKLNYINLPVLAQLMFGEGFRIEAGPQVGFLVSAKDKFESEESDIKDNYKGIDISFPIGLGYLMSSGLGLDARWVPGLTDINKKSSESNLGVANNVFQVGLFYQFPMKHHVGHDDHK